MFFSPTTRRSSSKKSGWPDVYNLRGAASFMFSVLQIEDDRHITVKNLQQIDHLRVLRATAGRQPDIQPLGRVPPRVGGGRLRGIQEKIFSYEF